MPAYKAAKADPTGIHPGLTVKSVSGGMAVLISARPYYASATTGTVYRATIGRYNSNGVTPADKTEKGNTRSGTRAAPGQSWGTAPTVVGNPLAIVEAGERTQYHNTWRPARPGAEIRIVNAEEVGQDMSTGASNSDNHLLGWLENDPGIGERRLSRRARSQFYHYLSYYNCGAGVTTKGSQNRRNYGIALFRYGRRLPQDFDVLLLGAAIESGATGGRVVVSREAHRRSTRW